MDVAQKNISIVRLTYFFFKARIGVHSNRMVDLSSVWMFHYSTLMAIALPLLCHLRKVPAPKFAQKCLTWRTDLNMFHALYPPQN